LTGRDLAALILLGVLWGASFLFIRVAVPVFGPFALVELRVAIAVVALLVYGVAIGRLPKARAHWRRFLILGLVNSAIPFSLIAFAEIELTASLAAILNSTTVLFTAVVATIWTGEALTPGKATGVVLGVAGVAALVGWDPIAVTGAVLLSVVAMLLASLFYALGATYAKRAFADLPPLTMAVGQQTGAAVLLLVPASVSLPERELSVAAGLSVLGLAVPSTAVAYILYFRLIESVGPTSTVTVTFLVPVFGLLFGVLLLDEPFGLGTLAGLGIVLLSVALDTGIGSPKGKPA
jgi:drug/metabolite transporter (DMT)-like permease